MKGGTQPASCDLRSFPTPPSERIKFPPDASGFEGLRARMGVHAAAVKDIAMHHVTKRVVYDHQVVPVATRVSDAACGGQIILTSRTLAACTAISSTAFIMHLGRHIVDPQAEKKTAQHVTISPASKLTQLPAPGRTEDNLIDRTAEEGTAAEDSLNVGEGQLIPPGPTSPDPTPSTGGEPDLV